MMPNAVTYLSVSGDLIANCTVFVATQTTNGTYDITLTGGSGNDTLMAF